MCRTIKHSKPKTKYPKPIRTVKDASSDRTLPTPNSVVRHFIPNLDKLIESSSRTALEIMDMDVVSTRVTRDGETYEGVNGDVVKAKAMLANGILRSPLSQEFPSKIDLSGRVDSKREINITVASSDDAEALASALGEE